MFSTSTVHCQWKGETARKRSPALMCRGSENEATNTLCLKGLLFFFFFWNTYCLQNALISHNSYIIIKYLKSQQNLTFKAVPNEACTQAVSVDIAKRVQEMHVPIYTRDS